MAQPRRCLLVLLLLGILNFLQPVATRAPLLPLTPYNHNYFK